MGHSDSNFDYVLLNDLIVEKVLLELKEPTNAKRALAFFHWSAQRKKFEHGNWSYCITIHISIALISFEKKCWEPFEIFQLWILYFEVSRLLFQLLLCLIC